MPNPNTVLTQPAPRGAEAIVNEDALRFVGELVRAFRPRIAELLARRGERQRALDAGGTLGFLDETESVRRGAWHCIFRAPELCV